MEERRSRARKMVLLGTDHMLGSGLGGSIQKVISPPPNPNFIVIQSSFIQLLDFFLTKVLLMTKEIENGLQEI